MKRRNCAKTPKQEKIANARQAASLLLMERNDNGPVRAENEETKEELIERLLDKSELDYKCCG